jgi:hypothetical protein
VTDLLTVIGSAVRLLEGGGGCHSYRQSIHHAVHECPRGGVHPHPNKGRYSQSKHTLPRDEVPAQPDPNKPLNKRAHTPRRVQTSLYWALDSHEWVPVPVRCLPLLVPPRPHKHTGAVGGDVYWGPVVASKPGVPETKRSDEQEKTLCTQVRREGMLPSEQCTPNSCTLSNKCVGVGERVGRLHTERAGPSRCRGHGGPGTQALPSHGQSRGLHRLECSRGAPSSTAPLEVPPAQLTACPCKPACT